MVDGVLAFVNGSLKIIISLLGIFDDPIAVWVTAENIKIPCQKVDVIDGDKIPGKAADDGGLLFIKIGKTFF